MSQLSPAELLEQLNAYLKDDSKLRADATTQAKVQKASYKLSRRLEEPSAAIGRVLVTQPVEWMVISIGCDLGLFAHVASEAKTPQELAEATKAELALIVRILRACSGLGIVTEPSPGHYQLSPQYALLGNPLAASSLPAMGGFLHPIYRSMPAFLRSKSYTTPTSKTDTAMQLAFSAPNTAPFDILKTNPDTLKAIGSFLSVWATDSGPLQDVYPMRQNLAEGFTDGVFFVDVGGGLGQRSLQLRKAVPDLPGRFVVQDQRLFQQQGEGNVQEGIEWQGYDFFTAQPVKGARAYYLRHILHDWRDEESLQILAVVREAMTPGYSKLLIHELVMPESEPDPWDVSSDMDMMSHLASWDRTEAEWRKLLGEAGFGDVKFWMPEVGGVEACIEVMKK